MESQWVEENDEAREESEQIETKSRMSFLLWIGKVTCWLRLKEERRDRNWEVRWSVGLSRWMLESPVIMNSWGVQQQKKSENIAKNRRRCCKSPKFINSCEIPDTADNRGCRFWNMFTGLVILCMIKQLHAL